jgi:hypothetical protein
VAISLKDEGTDYFHHLNRLNLEMLIESDDVKYRTKQELDETNRRECQTLLSVLRAYQHKDNSNLRLPIRNEQEDLIFYIWRGLVFMPGYE